VRLREHKHLPPSLIKTQKTNQLKMSSDSPLNVMAPPMFDGTNYQVWAVRMEAHLDGNGQWEAVADLPLLDNPSIAQIKNHMEKRQRKSKAKASLLAAVSSSIFTTIKTLKTTNEI